MSDTIDRETRYKQILEVLEGKELTAKEILKNSFKKINCPSLGSVRTTICQMNKKFEAQFDDRIIYPTDDKRAYMHKILGFDPFTMFPLLMKRRY